MSPDIESGQRDIRDQIFRGHRDRNVTAVVIAEAAGLLSGIQRAKKLAEGLGLSFQSDLNDGDSFHAAAELARVSGKPFQIVKAEEVIIGTLSKTSGIATRARQMSHEVGPRCRVVSGGWKKMPHDIKDMVRQAVVHGGAGIRIIDGPFIYLDKNYVRILGGVREALEAVVPIERSTVIQIRGETGPVVQEAIEAARAGAAVIMIDTGRSDDLTKVAAALREEGLRSKVQIAFAGNISQDNIPALSKQDVDILDIGYAILDAPCLPIRFDVTQVH
jgi:nicotinate-nucleotide pyrophosphorylase (carboxylating)